MTAVSKNNAPAPADVAAKPKTQFMRAEGLWYQTKADKIGDPTNGIPIKNASARNRLAAGDNSFMHIKRQNPNQSWGSSDKHFKPPFTTIVPGLKHAHLAQDLSLVYLVQGNIVYLFGFFTHGELGTGQPGNPRRQRAMATQFAHAKFVEE